MRDATLSDSIRWPATCHCAQRIIKMQTVPLARCVFVPFRSLLHAPNADVFTGVHAQVLFTGVHTQVMFIGVTHRSRVVFTSCVCGVFTREGLQAAGRQAAGGVLAASAFET